MKKKSSKRLLSRDYKLAKCQIDDESDLSVHFLKFERDTSKVISTRNVYFLRAS